MARVSDYAVYTMRWVQTALCTGPAINLPPATEPNTAIVYYSLIDRSFAVSPWLPAHTRLWLAQGQPPPKRMEEVKVEVEFRVNLPRWFHFCLFCALCQLQCPSLSPFFLLLSVLCTWFYFTTLGSVAICPTSCSLFILMCLFWCFITLNPSSLFCLAPLSPSRHRCFRIFLFLSWTQRSHLSAIPHPASPSYSHAHIDINLRAHTHPPLSPPRRLHLCARLWPGHGSGCRCGILEMFELSDTQVQW